MRAAVVANCQARPLADIMQKMCGKISSIATIIVHLADKNGQERDYDLLSNADVVFSQLVSDQYFVPHVATRRLRAVFGKRIISWPNIYFRGQCPDLGYAAVGGTRRLMGPLRDYHLRSIYGCWKAGQSVKQCRDMLLAPDGGYEQVLQPIAAASLNEIKMRETDLDTGIADAIESEWKRRRLFFTFNHPTSFLLETMARRLLAVAGLAATSLPMIRGPEPLGLVVPPVLPREADALGGGLPASDGCTGAEISITDSKLVIGRQCQYSIDDLVGRFYQAYDVQLRGDDIVNFTPG